MNNHQVQGNYGDILIVDDSPDNLRVLSTMLAEQGYRVRKVINGNLALKVAQIAPPDLILLDILMPEMDGYEVCSLLKANPQTWSIPIIFISALNDISAQIKAFEVGGIDYITKPFQEAEVLARVKSQLTIQNLHLKLQQQTHSLQKQNALLQQQIQERQRAEAETCFLLRTAQAISSCDDFHSALEITLRQVCQMIGWDFGEAWIPNDEGTILECGQGWYATEASLEKFRHASEKLTFPPGIGFLGQIWLTKQPKWIEDVSLEQYQGFLRYDIALDVGLKAALGVPIVLNDHVLAVLVFFKKEKLKPVQRLIELINAFATQLGLFQREKIEAALKAANLQLERLAAIDSLTGIPNRRKFDAHFHLEWRRMAREQLPLSLILCDIDHFKSYNDTYGHLAGDFCLQQVAQAISRSIKRPADLAARYGGEEFAIILPNTHVDGALQVAEATRNEVQNLKIAHAQSAVHNYVTISAGVVSVVPQNKLDPSSLITVADQALYEAKKQGKNRSIGKSFEELSSELLLNRLSGLSQPIVSVYKAQ
ncbi:MAG: diguanylate cyclase [Stigonema ocellatum SAG 48.90 = DSM 106950]|nr:diguanylate cyclase [Stigonema ocellatum SAG 48.90 = DSM 106950]